MSQDVKYAIRLRANSYEIIDPLPPCLHLQSTKLACLSYGEGNKLFVCTSGERFALGFFVMRKG